MSARRLRRLDVAEQKFHACGADLESVLDRGLTLGASDRGARAVVLIEVQLGDAVGRGRAALLFRELLCELGPPKVGELSGQWDVNAAVVLVEGRGIGRVVVDDGQLDAHTRPSSG